MMKRWIESEPAANGALSATQIESWRERGFTFVHGLLPNDLLLAALADAAVVYPPPGTTAAESIKDFGSSQRFVFPALSDSVNSITLSDALLGAVAGLLGVSIGEIRLTQSDLWPKYGRDASSDDADNRDQRMHCDYPNHTLTHPPPWDRPDAVEVIIYLSDVETCGGATALVPRQSDDDPAYPWPIVQMPGVAGLRYVNNREKAEALLRDQAPEAAAFREQHLYAREILARYRFGSILFYRHDTWHRGTPVNPGALRLVHNLTFKKAHSEWVNVLHTGWSWSMYRQDQQLERLIAGASVDQRAVLGFPLPGSTYWTPATISAVKARYGAHGIDMSPYVEALASAR